MHWHGDQCLRRPVPNYAVVFRLGWVYLPESLCHQRSRRRWLFLRNTFCFFSLSARSRFLWFYQYSKWLNISIWRIDGTLRSSTTSGQSGPESNVNDMNIYIAEIISRYSFSLSWKYLSLMYISSSSSSHSTSMDFLNSLSLSLSLRIHPYH